MICIFFYRSCIGLGMPYVSRRSRYNYFCPKCQKKARWNGLSFPTCQICRSVDCIKCSNHPVIVCKDCFQTLPLKTQKKLTKMKRRYMVSIGLFFLLLFTGVFGFKIFPEENLNYRDSLIDLLKDTRFWVVIALCGIAVLPFMLVFWLRYTRYELDPSLVEELETPMM